MSAPSRDKNGWTEWTPARLFKWIMGAQCSVHRGWVFSTSWLWAENCKSSAIPQQRGLCSRLLPAGRGVDDSPIHRWLRWWLAAKALEQTHVITVVLCLISYLLLSDTKASQLEGTCTKRCFCTLESTNVCVSDSSHVEAIHFRKRSVLLSFEDRSWRPLTKRYMSWKVPSLCYYM